MNQLLEREAAEQTPNDGLQQGKRRFQKAFVMYLSALTAVILLILVMLWVALARYQSGLDNAAAMAAETAQDRTALQETLLRFVEKASAEDWTERYMQTPRLESRAAVAALFSELLERSRPQCYKAADWTPAQPAYSVYLDGQPFARVCMIKQDGVWNAGEVMLLLTGNEGGSITVPEGTTVRCGDIVLEQETYAGPSVPQYPKGPDADRLIDPVYGRTYTVSGLLVKPEFVLERTTAPLAPFPEGYALTLAAEAAKPYQARAEALVQDLVNYYMRGKADCRGNMERAAAHTIYGSQAHKVITGAYDGVIWMQNFYLDYACETTAGNVLIWAENCYSVDVSCRASGSNGQSDKTMDGAYRVFFTDTGAGFGITGLTTL